MKKALIVCVISILILTSVCGCSKEYAVRLGNVLILGDSFSTYEGYIPEEYKTWYSAGVDYAGVSRVEHTWWHRVIKATHSNLLLNSSYSGSTVCHTGYDGEDYSEFSFVTRISQLIASGFFEENTVDTLFIYGGLNDCWAQSPRGEIKYGDITAADQYCFYPALSFIFLSVAECSPHTRIIFVIEEQLDDEMKQGIRTVAAHYGVKTVEPQNVGLEGSHPNADGMKSIADQVLDALNNE